MPTIYSVKSDYLLKDADEIERSAKESLKAWTLLGQTEKYSEAMKVVRALRDAAETRSLYTRREILRNAGFSIKSPKQTAKDIQGETRKANPMKKPTPAQLAARARFAEMARSGAFKRKAKRNPAKKTVSQKISQLMHEGYPQKQAVAVALSEQRKGKVRRNPITETLIYGLPAGETRDYMEELLYGGGLKLTEAQIQQVLKAASDAGFHSFRITGFDPTKRPDFAKAVATRTRKRNPATGRKGSHTKLNPMAAPVQVSSDSMFKYAVEAKRSLGSAGAVFETVAAFHTKLQAKDYAKAILAAHPNVTLRIKTYARQK